jgi:hypothetical protein
VRREHLLAYMPHAREHAHAAQRAHPGLGKEDRSTAHSRLVEARCFFADVCIWATEEGSPFAAFAPLAVPLERHDLRNQGFEQARRRQAKRALATIRWMYVVSASLAPSGPAEVEAADSSSQGIAVVSTVTPSIRRPTTLLPSVACQLGPPKWVVIGLPLSS